MADHRAIVQQRYRRLDQPSMSLIDTQVGSPVTDVCAPAEPSQLALRLER
jgi:hypothetical protein